MNKKELRKLLRKRKLSDDYIREAGQIIAEKVIELPQFQQACSVFCYLSSDSEPSTDRILAEAFRNKRVYVPKCIDDHEMKAVRIHSNEGLIINGFGIREPKNMDETETSFDLMIVPCMAAGTHGERLGHGRGYYDRFLQNASGNIICLCFEKNIRDDIEMDEHDISMPCVITEEKNYE